MSRPLPPVYTLWYGIRRATTVLSPSRWRTKQRPPINTKPRHIWRGFLFVAGFISSVCASNIRWRMPSFFGCTGQIYFVVLAAWTTRSPIMAAINAMVKVPSAKSRTSNANPMSPMISRIDLCNPHK